jgi:hypothetical protein
MGSDPQRSVLDAHSESHDIRRLLVEQVQRALKLLCRARTPRAGAPRYET